ncbi:MAG: DUF3597 domain-containing protein [Burkholderiales bacterium]|nr:DUF3597 domain-containing protein [Burkholderiales bacterium]
MSIFGKIFDRIFSKADAANPVATTDATPYGGKGAPSGEPSTALAPVAAAATGSVDIEQVLNAMAANNPQKLNWRTSIVDLMKLVGMESSLQERRELADELGYTGDKADTAAMNVWLHKQVMKKLQDNGGKVPPSLVD